MKESEYARALMDYDVSAPSLLNFKKGDIIKIIERNDNEWFTGEIGKSRGQVNFFKNNFSKKKN